MAKGSHITYGGWEPRTCHRCGGKIAVTRRTDSYHFSRYGGPGEAPVSRHAGGCPTGSTKLPEEGRRLASSADSASQTEPAAAPLSS